MCLATQCNAGTNTLAGLSYNASVRSRPVGNYCRYSCGLAHPTNLRLKDFFATVFDGILHFGGQTAVTLSVKNPRRDFETNALGTFNLLEIVRKICPETKIIYSSSNKEIDLDNEEELNDVIHRESDFVLFPMAKHYIDRFFNQDGE